MFIRIKKLFTTAEKLGKFMVSSTFPRIRAAGILLLLYKRLAF